VNRLEEILAAKRDEIEQCVRALPICIDERESERTFAILPRR
jgi:hypothetical protein